jgi:ABC-type Zn uptake system ZnuABC Zn-binding protein ZnuA
VATFSILGDLVQNVGGTDTQLHTLVGPDGDSHAYIPLPNDAVALAEADLVFENGLGFETWLDQLYESAASQAQRVVVTTDIAPGQINVGEEAGETDPHVWQDVTYAMTMVNTIRDSLVAADSTNAADYQANATAYLAQLQRLDDDIKERVATLPADDRKLVTNHDALGYFAARYGFEVVGTAFGSISTEGGGPSASDMAALIEEVKSAGVPTIFTENIENSDVINQVALEAGVKVGEPLYTDALGAPGTEGETYLKMMRHNLQAIVAGLQR